MKYIKSFKYIKFLLASLCIVFSTSCTDDNYVHIDSLSTDGDEFYCNQKIKMWMVVHSDDLMKVDYEWSCEGGRITQPQGLDENTWQAPNVPGTYTVSCKVTSGGKSEIRTHSMYVSSYYFEKFEKLPFSFTAQSESTISYKTETVNGVVNGYAEFKGNSTANAYRYLNKSFNDSELKLPFSTMSKIGFTSNIPKDTLKVGTSKGPHSLYYAWGFNRDPKKTDAAYPTEFQFEWYPNKDGNVPNIPSVTPQSKFNVRLRISYLDNGIAKTIVSYLTVNELSTFADKIYKKVSLSIDKDYLIRVNLDGVEVFTSDFLQTFRRSFNCVDNVYVNWWRIGFPVGASKELPVLYLDDVYSINDGTILK